MLGLTNGRALCAIVVPVNERWVNELLHQTLSRVLHVIDIDEKEREGGERQLIPLGDQVDTSEPTVGAPMEGALQRVSIREVSGELIERAAQSKQVLGITDNRVLRAVLIPITQKWLDQLVDSNLSRILRGIEVGERQIGKQNWHPLQETFADGEGEH